MEKNRERRRKYRLTEFFPFKHIHQNLLQPMCSKGLLLLFFENFIVRKKKDINIAYLMFGICQII